jgi:DNA mismatch repair protein MutS
MCIITGPNNGGKSTYVKTVGLIQWMAQQGLFVPAKSARVSQVDGIYTHFVSPDDITEGEGRYLNELRRMRYIFENATPHSLVILDEPCGGTSYEEGKAQSRVILEGLANLGPTTYFTTHMHELARDLPSTPGFERARNLQAACKYNEDGSKLVYTYKIKPGVSGKSYGMELAKETGLDRESLKKLVDTRAREEGFEGVAGK